MLPLDTWLRRLPGVLLLAGTVTLFALATFGVRSWLASRDALTQLKATVEAQKQVLTRAATNEQQRNTAVAKTLAGISVAKRRVQTPAEILAQLPQILAPLPEPISLTLVPPRSAQDVPETEATVPQRDLKPLYDFAQDCRACSAQLAAAQGDLADEQSKVAALIKERDAASHAVKGGFWLRAKRAAKWFAIGAAVGALAAESTHR